MPTPTTRQDPTEYVFADEANVRRDDHGVQIAYSVQNRILTYSRTYKQGGATPLLGLYVEMASSPDTPYTVAMVAEELGATPNAALRSLRALQDLGMVRVLDVVAAVTV